MGMELLAPAGSPEALKAAVQAGADAVYLGGGGFNARMGAVNFDGSALAEAVAYAHLRGVKVYLTANTLVRDDEWKQLEALLEQARGAGADALIVQDVGVARFARERVGLPLHASTQMSVHSAQGVTELARLGFARVVAGRECGREELARMVAAGASAWRAQIGVGARGETMPAGRAHCGSEARADGAACEKDARMGHPAVEIEAFVHGALCVSVSGQCLMSSVIGGRSGNRGACAQPCRLPYTAVRAPHGGVPSPREETSGALLSPRDLCLIDRLRELRDAGVTSLKIEGRAKRAEYVAVVVAQYRAALDALEAEEAEAARNVETANATGAAANVTGKNPGAAGTTPGAARDDLLRIFNRGGFTAGYFDGVEDAALMGHRRVNHAGVPLGEILDVARHGGNAYARVRLRRDLRVGDGLEGRGGAADAYGIVASCGGRAGEVIGLSVPPGARRGDKLDLTSDTRQLDAARALARSNVRTLPIRGDLSVRVGSPARLTLTAPGTPPVPPAAAGPASAAVTVTVESDEPVEPARNRETRPDDFRAQLDKLGDTVYRWADLDVEAEPGAFMPVSAINSLRRKAVAALDAARLAHAHPACAPAPDGQAAHRGQRLTGSQLSTDSPPLADSGPSAACPPAAAHLPSADAQPCDSESADSHGKSQPFALAPDRDEFRPGRTQELIAQVTTPEQARACLDAGIDRVEWLPDDLMAFCRAFLPGATGDPTENIGESPAEEPGSNAAPTTAILGSLPPQMRARIGIVAPPFLRTDELESFAQAVRRAGFRCATVGNIGQITAMRRAAPIVRGGFGLNVMNASTAETLTDLGLTRVTLSSELTLAQAQALCRQLSLRTDRALAASPDAHKVGADMVIHGALPLMVLAHCPARAIAGQNDLSDADAASPPRGRAEGGGPLRPCPAGSEPTESDNAPQSSRAACNLCRTGRGARGMQLADRKGESFSLFPIRAQGGCHLLVLNGHTLSLMGKWDRVMRVGAIGLRMLFFGETPEQVAEICKLYRDLYAEVPGAAARAEAWLARTPKHTSGHAARGV